MNVSDIIKILAYRRWTLATAESCTGGQIASTITDIPGASVVFAGSLVCYANSAKTNLLGVPESTLLCHGAVSHPVAQYMATGVRTRFKTTLGLATTGIAGPTGGSDSKPVGTVYLSIASPAGQIMIQRRQFSGSRSSIQLQATKTALEMVSVLLKHGLTE